MGKKKREWKGEGCFQKKIYRIKSCKKEESWNLFVEISAFFVVRRIGVTKPPVQLGVGKNTLV